MGIAVLNEYSGKHHIEINASTSTIDYISLSIKNSELASIFDLSAVNWRDVDRKANRKIYEFAVRSYNDKKSVNDIATELKVSPDTVRRILRCATADGKCNYSSYNSIIQNQRLASNARKRAIRCITTNEIFDSLQSASIATGISPKALSNCLCGRSNSTLTSNRTKLRWDYYISER